MTFNLFSFLYLYFSNMLLWAMPFIINEKICFHEKNQHNLMDASLLQGSSHNFTLIDGEMVIDKLCTKFERRYLAYDLMMVNGVSIVEVCHKTRLYLTILMFCSLTH